MSDIQNQTQIDGSVDEQKLMQQALDSGVDSSPLTIRQMLEAGVHFGHQTNRWNPKMKMYIFGARNGIHIIDLQQSLPLFQRAQQFVLDLVSRGGNILFVGTKKQIQELVQQEASRSGMFYVNERWLGGTLTNFKTVKASIDQLHALEKMLQDGTAERLTKKEALMNDRQREKLERSLGGIKQMTRLPAALFVIDTQKEHLAIAEARKLSIPVIAIADTNSDPDSIDYPIPGNDDALRAVKVVLEKIADACIVGKRMAGERAAQHGGSSAVAPDSSKGEQQPVDRHRKGPKVETARKRTGTKAAPAAVATPDSVTVAPGSFKEVDSDEKSK